MTTIDEIMAAAYAPAASAAEGRSVCPRLAAAELRSIITQAIAEARADGAREMRELCATVCDTTPPHPFRRSIEAAHAIRALPLPAGTVNVVMDREHGGLTFAPAKREPVRLTDAGIDAIRISERSPWWSGDHWCCEDADWYPLIRAIETAVLAANGLEAK